MLSGHPKSPTLPACGVRSDNRRWFNGLPRSAFDPEKRPTQGCRTRALAPWRRAGRPGEYGRLQASRQHPPPAEAAGCDRRRRAHPHQCRRQCWLTAPSVRSVAGLSRGPGVTTSGIRRNERREAGDYSWWACCSCSRWGFEPGQQAKMSMLCRVRFTLSSKSRPRDWSVPSQTQGRPPPTEMSNSPCSGS